MEKTFEKIEELAGNVKQYVNSKIDAVKLSAAEKSSAIISNLIAGLFVAGVFLFFFIFVSIALALLIGSWLDKMWAGFLIMAGFYLLLGLVVWSARERIIRLPVMNAIIKQLFKEDDDEED